MFSAVLPGSTLALALLGFCLVLVIAFEVSNGFHDTANAVATVIYTNSLKPTVAVVWSGALNFLGVLIGGIAVAYALVEILPPEVLSPPDGNPAVAMLTALLVTALAWNIGTWALGIPNSSSHALIGSLVGISIAGVLQRHDSLRDGVDWGQIVKVLEALLASPILGFVGAWLLYRLIRLLLKDKHLYEPPEGDEPPIWWMRGVLILTCSGISFAHGTNDGQKSIGLIMLTIIGLAPLTFALNQSLDATKTSQLIGGFQRAGALIQASGDSKKAEGVAAAAEAATASGPGRSDVRSGVGADPAALRDQSCPGFAEADRGRAGRAGLGVAAEIAAGRREVAAETAHRGRQLCAVVGPHPVGGMPRRRHDDRLQADREDARRAARQAASRAGAGRRGRTRFGAGHRRRGPDRWPGVDDARRHVGHRRHDGRLGRRRAGEDGLADRCCLGPHVALHDRVVRSAVHVAVVRLPVQ